MKILKTCHYECLLTITQEVHFPNIPGAVIIIGASYI